MRKHIFLVGFMGAGKTIIGAELQARTGMSLVDTDQRIAEAEGKEVSMIFAELGEAHFRKLEKQLLQELSVNQEALIISTGGGMFADKENQRLMRSVGHTFYIRRSFRQLFKVIRHDIHRPLAAKASKKDLFLLFRKRKKYYEKAEFTISNFRYPVKGALKILSLLHKSEQGR
jgi:shikimate kinase